MQNSYSNKDDIGDVEKKNERYKVEQSLDFDKSQKVKCSYLCFSADSHK